MNKFAMNNLYSHNELHESLCLESAETLFDVRLNAESVLHTERSERVGTSDTGISG